MTGAKSSLQQDPSDVAFLARHHKLEREEKLSHYYMRTMQNKDGPEKHDKRVEQAIKSMRPPPIAEGTSIIGLHGSLPSK